MVAKADDVQRHVDLLVGGRRAETKVAVVIRNIGPRIDVAQNLIDDALLLDDRVEPPLVDVLYLSGKVVVPDVIPRNLEKDHNDHTLSHVAMMPTRQARN